MIGIIGGSGFYDLVGLQTVRIEDIPSPFGDTSASIRIGKLGDTKVAFLPRHGETHALIPSEINYRANIWALKAVGVTRIISVSAVGSLREKIKPGDFAIPSQYFDHTRGIRGGRSFFGNGLVAHVSTAQPVCSTLSSALAEAGKAIGHTIHEDVTYACVEGPRLGTRAESMYLRDMVKADLVGMTNIPEVFLAREAQMCYATLAVCTDYDCWQDDPAHFVTVEAVIKRFGESVGKAKDIVAHLLDSPPEENPEDTCRKALDGSVMTPPDHWTAGQKAMMEVLKQ